MSAVSSSDQQVGGSGTETLQTLTTPGVTPGGSNRATYVSAIGAINGTTPNYWDEARYTNSGGALINLYAGADHELSYFSFTEAYTKIRGGVAPAAGSSLPIYVHWPAGTVSAAVTVVYLEDVDQTTPYGTEVTAGTGLNLPTGAGPHTVTLPFTGLTPGQRVVATLTFFMFGTNLVSTVAATSEATIILEDAEAPEFEGRRVRAVTVTGEADGSGNITLSLDCSAPVNDDFIWYDFSGNPVNDAAGGPTEYDVDAAQAVDVGDSSANQGVLVRSATQAVDVNDTATASVTALRSASQAVDVGDSATARGTFVRTASQAVDVNDTAAALRVHAAPASQAVDVGDSSTIQNTVAAAAAQAVDVGDTATSAAGSDLLGAASVDLNDTATNTAVQGVTGGTQAIDVSDSATSQAVMASAAADAADLGDSATSALVGGNVYDVEAVESIDLNDSATRAGGGDSGDIAELEDKIDALTVLVTQLAQDVATARTFYTGGYDYSDDAERRDLLRHYDKKIDIQEQNAMLMKMFKAIVTQESTP